MDYSKISIEELIEKRRQLQKDIADGKACVGCDQIIECEEENIEVGKINYLSIGQFSTCNLRCRYCYFTHEQLGKKILPERKYLLPFVSKLWNEGFLKDNVEMGVAGGEPTLLQDIPETCRFLEENCKNPTVILLSNSSIEKRTKEITNAFKDLKKIKRNLYTSIDAGTRDTYKNVRGKDLYETVCKNLISYAKNNTFNAIALKYILLFDHSNTSDEDIFGFLDLFSNVLLHQKGNMALTIDCDMLSKKEFDEPMVAAAGKLHYVAEKLFRVPIVYAGGGLVLHNKKALARIHKLEDYSNNYKKMPKTMYEKFMLFKLSLKTRLYHIKKNYMLLKKVCKFIRIINRK